MTLNDYSFQFGSFVFGGTNSPWQVMSIDGLEGIPELRVQDDNRGYNDGALTGRDFYNGRNITFTINTFARDGLSAQENYRLLQNALLPQQSGTSTLTFKLSGTSTEKIISARMRTRVTTVDPDYTYGLIRSQVMMFCPDPRYYDSTENSLSLSITATNVGRTYNRTYNLTYVAAYANNQNTVTNSGNIYSSPVIQIIGPVVNPVIGYVEGNAYLQANVSLGASDSLVVDMGNRLVTLNGSAARNLVSNNSEWWDIPANSTATINFSAQSSTAGASATVNWRNAYI
jgi:phage-related protein